METAIRLLDEARRATGLENFGEASFREGLEVLVRSATTEGRLTPLGESIIAAQIVSLLKNRLQVEDWYRRHPEIDEQQIVRPLVGVGLPRTGSSALQCLLAQDPATRFTRYWEAEAPCPPPETATEHSDPRIALSTASIAAQDRLAPRIKAMVPWSATEPTEEQHFMAFDFKSQLLQCSAHVPTYSHWLHFEADLEPTYQYVKRVLKLLQWRCPPKRWVMKNPAHILFLEALDKSFPDARFVMTHRDVANVIPSVADLYFELNKMCTNQPDPLYLGTLHADIWHEGMMRLMAFRDAGNESRFFDIQFADAQREPIEEIRKLYAWLGDEFTAEAERRMRDWSSTTPRDKHGIHEYRLEQFGLDIGELHERFSAYSERFGVRA